MSACPIHPRLPRTSKTLSVEQVQKLQRSVAEMGDQNGVVVAAWLIREMCAKLLASGGFEMGAVIVGWMVGTPNDNPAMYNLAQRQEAFKAAGRWDHPITALMIHPEAPKP